MACESAGDVFADFELLCAAVALIPADDGFRIPTQPARKALLLAERYLEWCTNDRNKQIGLQFAQELLAGLERYFLSQTFEENECGRVTTSFVRLLISA